MNLNNIGIIIIIAVAVIITIITLSTQAHWYSTETGMMNRDTNTSI